MEILKSHFLYDLLWSIILSTIFFAIWPTSLILDDGGIILKYMDNFQKGYFYTYNIEDGPIFGISGFIHGISAGLLTFSGLLSPLNSLFASNFIGSIILILVIIQILRFHSEGYFIPIFGAAWLYFCTTDLIINVKQGLETSLHIGIMLSQFVFLLKRNFPLLCISGAISIISKLDSVPVFIICVLLFLLIDYFENERIELKNGLQTLFKWNFSFLGVWIIICFFIFGSPIPQTVYSKLFFHPHPSNTLFPFLNHFLLIKDSLFLLLFLLLCNIYAFRKERIFIIIENLSFMFCLIGYLALYCFYNPHEQMSWYYAFPELLINIQILLLAFQLFKKLFKEQKFLPQFLLISTLTVFQIPFVLDQSYIRLCLLENSITELISIGRFVRNNSHHKDKLMTGHGFIARESERYCIDYSGLNSREATNLQLNTEKIAEKHKPEWITFLGFIPHSLQINEGYELIKTSYEVTQFGAQPYRIYQKSASCKGITESIPINSLSCREGFMKNQDGVIICETSSLEINLQLNDFIKNISKNKDMYIESILFGVEKKIENISISAETINSSGQLINTQKIPIDKLNNENQIAERMQECQLKIYSQDNPDKIYLHSCNSRNIPEKINFLGPAIKLRIRNSSSSK
ncbi:MAG: hypothetical protein HQM10_05270 [Candidatus Riflebacteria bacterium]|nr:hypothetical protein [Candidatus Riflebacteria bacterium]